MFGGHMTIMGKIRKIRWLITGNDKNSPDFTNM